MDICNNRYVMVTKIICPLSNYCCQAGLQRLSVQFLMQPFIHVITSPASYIFGLGWSLSRGVPNRIFLKLAALGGLVAGAEA